MPDCYVYILANQQYTVLYTGMTNDMERRLAEHRAGLGEFSTRYKLSQLVYCEPTPDVNAAIAREKQLKGWTRAKKVALIEAANPDWRDLADRWAPTPPPDPSTSSG